MIETALVVAFTTSIVYIVFLCIAVCLNKIINFEVSRKESKAIKYTEKQNRYLEKEHCWNKCKWSEDILCDTVRKCECCIKIDCISGGQNDW